MHQTWRRGRGHLRVLRTGTLRGLPPFVHRSTPHGLFERLCRRPPTRRPSPATDSPAQCAKRAGQRVLLLRQWRTICRGVGSRLVHVAFAVFNSVHGRLRRRADGFWHLVRPGSQETNALTREPGPHRSQGWACKASAIIASNTGKLRVPTKRRHTLPCVSTMTVVGSSPPLKRPPTSFFSSSKTG